MLDIIVGIAFGLGMGYLAWRSGYALVRGAAAIFVVVAAPFTLAGWVWGVPICLFFVADLAASRYQHVVKEDLGERFRQNARHDWARVASRTSWSLLIVAVYGVTGRREMILYVAYIGALAVALADAWATELGILSIKHPRLVSSGRSVKPGSAGAVSMLGLIASLVAAWLMGLFGLGLITLRSWLDKAPVDDVLVWLPMAACLGGLLGALVDSLLGATAQRIGYCEDCQERSEQLVHHCGRRTEAVRGWPWLDNEGVNWISCVVGAALATGLAQWLAQTNMQW